jgi:hypothetical protein
MDTKVNLVEVFGTIKAKVGFAEVFLLVVAVYGLYRYFTRDPRLASLPPHVRGWPIINQTLDQMQDDVIPLVQGWAKQYGEIFRTTSGTTTFIWLNSRKAVKELIDRRSVIYSSRHPQPMVEAAGGGKRMVFMPYGKCWRAIRNVIHRVCCPKKIANDSFSLRKCQSHIVRFRPTKRNVSAWIYLIALKTFIGIIGDILPALL